jgi:hypothetical protein
LPLGDADVRVPLARMNRASAADREDPRTYVEFEAKR